MADTQTQSKAKESKTKRSDRSNRRKNKKYSKSSKWGRPNFYSDPEKNLRRMLHAKRSGINFVSGTVSPAQSAKHKASEKNFDSFAPEDLEDMSIGLDYLCKCYNYDTTLSIEPKYMGSRFNLYLFNADPDESCLKSYGVTRNGFLVKPHHPRGDDDENSAKNSRDSDLSYEDFRSIVEATLTRLKPWMDEHHVRMMIIDGELLPWAVLGKGLINRHFRSVDAGLDVEAEFMKEYSFDSVMNSVLERFEGIDKFYPELSKSDRSLVYGDDLTKSYEKFQDVYSMPTTAEMEDYSGTYHRQIELYGRSTSVEFKPFSILKICFEDDTESIPLLDRSFTQGEMFKILNEGLESPHMQITIKSNTDASIALVRIRSFFRRLTVDEGYEGIVMKPAYVEQGQIPMMKVRNPEYLTIIYGYDYCDPAKLRRLVMSKTTSRKIKQSIQEFQLGMEMLVVPYDDIPNSKEYDSIFMRMIFKENGGRDIDPKL
jgi:PNKP adenylyltransferase domain, ligase domain